MDYWFYFLCLWYKCHNFYLHGLCWDGIKGWFDDEHNNEDDKSNACVDVWKMVII